MKKKLNLYCLLFIFAVGFGITLDFVTGFTDIKNAFMEGKRDADEEWRKAAPYRYENADVRFRSKSFSMKQGIGKDSIYNEITKEKEALSYNRMVVHVPKDKSCSSSYSEFLLGVGSTLYSVGILGFWIIFFMAIRSVKRGEVFLRLVASNLIKAAIFLLIAYVAEWVITWAHYEHAREMVEIANYEIVPNFKYNNSNLYISFGLLLLSQIIKHGTELKEEQELTI